MFLVVFVVFLVMLFVAMVGGLILVPVVSLFTKKQAKKVIADLFACYEEKVMTTRKEALEDE